MNKSKPQKITKEKSAALMSSLGKAILEGRLLVYGDDLQSFQVFRTVKAAMEQEATMLPMGFRPRIKGVKE